MYTVVPYSVIIHTFFVPLTLFSIWRVTVAVASPTEYFPAPIILPVQKCLKLNRFWESWSLPEYRTPPLHKHGIGVDRIRTHFWFCFLLFCLCVFSFFLFYNSSYQSILIIVWRSIVVYQAEIPRGNYCLYTNALYLAEIIALWFLLSKLTV